MTLTNSHVTLYPLSTLVVSLFVIVLCRMSRDSLVSIVTGLRARHPRFQSSWDKSFHDVRIDSGAHLASNGYRGLLPPGVKQSENEATTHLHPLPRLRINGAVLHSPLCTFMACMGQTLRF